MNYRGSFKRLRDNAKASMVGAIEIYNKPRFDYRDEVFVILLLNAWELLLKAVVSKGNRSIYYRKRRGQPYRTLGWRDALNRGRTSEIWPGGIESQALEANLDQLAAYRDNAVHFYNAPGFGVVIYSLAQTSILNFRDVLYEVFGHELGKEITWQLLPLAVEPPVDPVQYMRGGRPTRGNKAVDEFLRALAGNIEELETQSVDTSRLLTVYDVHLRSVKSVEAADVVVGVSGEDEGQQPVFIEKRVDPKRSHPYRMKQIIEAVGSVGQRRFNQYDFQAVVYFYGLRDRPNMCYQDEEVGLTRWSGDIVGFMRKLSADEIQQARSAYKSRIREKRSGDG